MMTIFFTFYKKTKYMLKNEDIDLACFVVVGKKR
jgi:hypothetical protein